MKIKEIEEIIAELEERVDNCNLEIDNRPNISKQTKRRIMTERSIYKASLNIIYKHLPEYRER